MAVHCGLNVEISFNIQSEIFIELSLLWWSLPVASVDDIPLLVESAMLVVDHDILVLSILASLNIEDLSFIIDNECTLHSEELPPS